MPTPSSFPPLQQLQQHPPFQQNPADGEAHHHEDVQNAMDLKKYQIDIPDAIQEARRDAASLPNQYSLGMYDVGCGRGQRYCNHPGNLRFRDIVNQHVDTYLNATSKVAKTTLIVSILDQVRRGGVDGHNREVQRGRFVKQHDDGTWVELGDAASRDKVSNALRSAVAQRRSDGSPQPPPPPPPNNGDMEAAVASMLSSFKQQEGVRAASSSAQEQVIQETSESGKPEPEGNVEGNVKPSLGVAGEFLGHANTHAAANVLARAAGLAALLPFAGFLQSPLPVPFPNLESVAASVAPKEGATPDSRFQERLKIAAAIDHISRVTAERQVSAASEVNKQAPATEDAKLNQTKKPPAATKKPPAASAPKQDKQKKPESKPSANGRKKRSDAGKKRKAPSTADGEKKSQGTSKRGKVKAVTVTDSPTDWESTTEHMPPPPVSSKQLQMPTTASTEQAPLLPRQQSAPSVVTPRDDETKRQATVALTALPPPPPPGLGGLSSPVAMLAARPLPVDLNSEGVAEVLDAVSSLFLLKTGRRPSDRANAQT